MNIKRLLYWRARRPLWSGVLTCLCLTSGRLAAQTTTWTGNAGDSEWNTSANWSNGLPPAGAAVTFGPSSSTSIHAYAASDRALDVRTSGLRRKLGDSPQRPRFIRTVRSESYMLVAPHGT